MTELEIRELLRSVCRSIDLERRAKKVVRKLVVPSMLGAGLALSGCGDRDPAPKDDSTVASEMGPVYGAPDATLPDSGPMPPYMAPDAGPGPQPLYAAPAPDGAGPEPQPDYMAPDP